MLHRSLMQAQQAAQQHTLLAGAWRQCLQAWQPAVPCSRVRAAQRLACSKATAAAPALKASAPQTRDLSDEQAAAVLSGDTHIRVIAGPGSGKTRVLTQRVAQLVTERGVAPNAVLCITFTKKAALELQERLHALLGRKAFMVKSGTFHSLACNILRHQVHLLEDPALPRGFAIYSQEESRALLRREVKELLLQQRMQKLYAGLGPDQQPSAGDVRAAKKDVVNALRQWVPTLHDAISTQKNLLPTSYRMDGKQVGLARLADGCEDPIGASPVPAERAWDLYHAALRGNRACDFDDLLSVAVAILQRFPQTRRKYQDSLRHILVDEFQDTNAPQYALVRLLTSEDANLFVVGDGDQAIYGWRGAVVTNMRKAMLQDYPGTVTLRLQDNYRSSPEVVRASSSMLNACSSAQEGDQRLQLRPIRRSGPGVQVVCAGDERQEADLAVQGVRRALAAGLALKDTAVLYRNHRLARHVEQALVAADIKYVLVGQAPFFGRTHVRNLLAYLRLTANLADNEALDRIYNLPARGLGEASWAKVEAMATAAGQNAAGLLFASCEQAVEDIAASGLLLEKNQLLRPDQLPEMPGMKELGLSKKAYTELLQLRSIVLTARLQIMQNTPICEALQFILQAIDYDSHTENSPNQNDDNHLVQQLCGIASAAQRAAIEEAERLRQQLGMDSDLLKEAPATAGLPALVGFLQDVAVQAEAAQAVAEGEEGKLDAVHLMTMHAAKGLEFERVHIIACEAEVLPGWRFEMGITTPAEQEEYDEHVRLFYVGTTRAKSQLCLSWAKARWSDAQRARVGREKSPFLKPIEQLAGSAVLGTAKPRQALAARPATARLRELQRRQAQARSPQRQWH